jgi:8-oxo-dGTP diphosphatase
VIILGKEAFIETPRKTINVVATLIRNGKRVFATARGYGNYKGWWEFLGYEIMKRMA